MKIINFTGTCDASGDLTITGTDNVIGYLEKIEMDYIDGDTGSDLVVTSTSTSGVVQAILTQANLGTADDTYYPRSPCDLVADGAALTNWADKILVTGNLKFVISNGGNAKDFRFIAYLSDVC